MICRELTTQQAKDDIVQRIEREFGLVHCFGDETISTEELFLYFSRFCNVIIFIEDLRVVAVVFLDVEDRSAEIHLIKLHSCNTKIGLKRLWEAIGHNIDELHSYITVDKRPITKFWSSLGFDINEKNDGYYATMTKDQYYG